MIIVNSSKILDAILEEAAEQKVPTLLIIKKLTELRDFPSMINVSEVDYLDAVVNSCDGIRDPIVGWEYHWQRQIVSMLEDIDGTEIQFSNKDNANEIIVVRRIQNLKSGEFKAFVDVKNRTLLINHKRYKTTSPESVGFVDGDILAVYEIHSKDLSFFIRRILNRNHPVHRSHYNYGRTPVLDNIKQYYYDQVFTSLSATPSLSLSNFYKLDIVKEFTNAWLKYKHTVINNLRKTVQKEELDNYVEERKCHRTQAMMDISFKISALESAVSCYKNELISPDCDMKRLKNYINNIDNHARALKGLNYSNRNVLGNRVMNVPGGRVTIEKLLAKKE